jgi:GTPase SAR1 family protein
MKKSFLVFLIFWIISNFCTASEDPGSRGRNKRSHDLPIILREVEDGEKDIENLEGKNVVIFIGRSQVGKSTTINKLLGKLEEQGDGTFFTPETDRRKAAPMNTGLPDEVGKSCTRLPISYDSDIGFTFLDTRGFFDTGEDPDGDIAASILTEMAIKRAASVRIVCLERCEDFARGLVSFKPMGETLSRLFVGHAVPILFLFNDYRPPVKIAPRFYSMTKEQQESKIKSDIRTFADNLLATQEATLLDVGDMVARRLGKVWGAGIRFFGLEGNQTDQQDVLRDDQYQEAVSKARYTAFLRYNFERNNYRYFDPSYPKSTTDLIEALWNLSPVSSSSLIFNGYNSARVEFDSAFANRLESMLLLAKTKARISKFSRKILVDLQTESQECVQYYENVLTGQAPFTKDGGLELNEGTHNNDLADIDRRKGVLEARKGTLLERKMSLTQEINDFLEREPSVFWTDRWREEAGFFEGWWRNHRCYYPLTTPFVDWTQSLETGTERYNLKDAQSPNLEVFYTSSIGYDCAGEVSVLVSPQNDASIMRLISERRTQINAIDRQLEGVALDLERLERDKQGLLRTKDANIAIKLRTFQERKKRNFQQQNSYMNDAVNEREKIDRVYEEHKTNIIICANIARKLNSQKPIVIDFLQFYQQFNDIISHEKEDLEERFTDAVTFVPLLDPIQAICANGGHNQSYERRVLEEHLRRNQHRLNENCPNCRASIRSLMPLGPLEAEMSGIIDEIHDDVLWVREAFNGIKQEWITLGR